jgi:DNA polymerase elongation subunit (family B)
MLPQHMLLVDYMDIYQKWDRSVDVKENYSLDWTAQKVLGVNKVKYPGSFQDLYRKDFDQYVFYNAIDTILVEEIHYKLKTMGTFLGLGNITRVEAMNAFSPISMLESTLARYAYKRGWVFPKINKKFERESYEGAFVFDPTSDLYEWVTSLDFASLYPSIMRQWLISIENFVTKDLNYQPNEHQIKCSSGAVFDSSREPLLPEILTDYYDKRKESKKISQQAEREASEIENILKQRQKKITQTLG